MRVTLLTNLVPPYREPVFAELNRLLDHELRVVLVAGREANRDWDFAPGRHPFAVRVLHGTSVRGRRPDRWIHLTEPLLPELVRHRPQALLIGGFDQPAYFEALALSRLLRIPAALWCGAHAGIVHPGPAMRLRRLMVRGVSAYVSYGTAAAELLVELGAPGERIAVGQNAVDVSAFAPEPHRAAARSMREALGLGERLVVLVVGQLIGIKGIPAALDAVGRVPEAVLVHVGRGPDERALRARAQAVAPGRAFFLGPKPYAELPAIYAMADVFLFPSFTDAWGLVLNEAMAAGLPVLASARAGATRDLVREGETGFVVDPARPESIAEKLSLLAKSPELRRKLGAAGRALIASVTPAAYARAMFDALKLAREGA